MGESRLALEEQRLIRHQFYQVQHQLDEWVRLTASVMAQALQSAAIVTQPRASQASLRHFELLSLYETVALLVLVQHDGSVRQERLLLESPATQDELSRLALRLNGRLHDADAATVERALITLPSDGTAEANERIVMESLVRMLTQLDLLVLRRLLLRRHHPIAAARRVHPRQSTAHPRGGRGAGAAPLHPGAGPAGDGDRWHQVIIGGENSAEELKDMSVVVARYGTQEHLSGLVGIVGPTRMQYGRAIAVVRYMTEVLNDLLTNTYNSYD